MINCFCAKIWLTCIWSNFDFDAKKSFTPLLSKTLQLLFVNIIAEENYSEVGQQISDLAKRNALLSAHSKQCRQLAEMYMDLVKQINDKITIFRDVARYVL